MISTLFLMILAHFIADFVLQTREMGKSKSHDFDSLATHLFIHVLVMFGFMIAPLGWFGAFVAATVNAGVHGLIDWNIWRGYKKFTTWRLLGRDCPIQVAERELKDFKWYDDYYFYLTIGIDQILHIGTLFLILIAL